jgi:recombinational DNA repair ATPase RecF
VITKLSVSNFKSVHQLDIDCRKINLFIGEPNTGKSNILEALALLSWCGHPAGGSLKHYVRFQSLQDLFYDQLLDHAVTILASGVNNVGLRLHFERSQFVFAQKPRSQPGPTRFLRLTADHSGDFSTAPLSAASTIKFYPHGRGKI